MISEKFLLQHPVFTTRDFAHATGSRVDTASRALSSRAKIGVLVSVTRGIWANPNHSAFSPYGLVPYLLGQEQGYVSFLSALHRHGVLSQIPRRIQIATTGHPRLLTTPVGDFEFFQIRPRYMQDGVQWFSGSVQYGIASAEKALLDCLYLSTRKGRRFSSFPELDFGSIRRAEFGRLLKTQHFPIRIQSAVERRFLDLVERNSSELEK